MTRCATSTIPNREKALKILSKSIYKELRQNGYEPKQIVALATELISLVTSDIKDDSTWSDTRPSGLASQGLRSLRNFF